MLRRCGLVLVCLLACTGLGGDHLSGWWACVTFLYCVGRCMGSIVAKIFCVFFYVSWRVARAGDGSELFVLQSCVSVLR